MPLRRHRLASLRWIARFVVLLPIAGGLAACEGSPASDDEFVGPFASWLDVKRDFGAVGDGQADDTVALQKALDALRAHRRASVLYLPAGTYRLTATLKSSRKKHLDNMVSIVGEHPADVILKWDGPADGTMFQWDAWYAKLSRLTFDGARRAGICLQYGPSFSTYNETSDIVCRDAKKGIVFGDPRSQGQAENEVLRCRFLRCGVGIETVNWNSMDIWIWYSLFEDCGRGIHNVMGSWHAWENVFLRSTICDLSIENLMVFSVVNNTSIGSRRFLDFTGGHSWGSPTSITGNRVLDPTSEWAVMIGNAGPYLVADNVFRIGEKSRAVRMTWGDQTFIGNRYSRADAVKEWGRFRRVDEQVVPADAISGSIPSLPAAPPRQSRPLFDLPPSADGTAIQTAIDQAARLGGQRPVVHLPKGAYQVSQTLVIPEGSDVQIVGDGASEIATRLVWSGREGDLILRIKGPSKATLRDLQFQTKLSRSILIETPDRPGGRIFADQLNVNGPVRQSHGRTAALRVSGFENTSLQFRALQGNGNGGSWVDVIGRGHDAPTVSTIGVFTGAAGSAAGQYDVRQGGRLVVRGVFHERSSDALNGLHLTDRGLLSFDATRFSYATRATSPTIAADSFRGVFTLATSMLLPVGSRDTCRFELRGNGSETSVLAMNDQFWVRNPGSKAQTVWLNSAKPPAHGGLIGCNMNSSEKDVLPGGFELLDNLGDRPASEDSNNVALAAGTQQQANPGVDDATIVRHLAALRATRPFQLKESPTGDTDIRLHRVVANGGRGAAVEIVALEEHPQRVSRTTDAHLKSTN